MKPPFLIRDICKILLFIFYNTVLFSQTSVLTINTQAQGNNVAQQQINLQPPGGNVIYNVSNGPGHLYIDKNIQLPNSYQANQTSNLTVRPLDKNLAPGSINANYKTDMSGAFNYQIPLQLPPGTNNMVPSIGLAYNSNGGDDEVGMGWSISGLSVITRIPKDNFHNATTSTIEFSATGPFSLDGNRLSHQGINASSQNYFYTENETFSKITFVGPHFEVKTKSGLTMIYGGSSSAILNLTQGAAAWYLTKTIDNYGNYVEYTYLNSGNEVAINEINYTGNASASMLPYNKVKFYYDIKSNPQQQYLVNNLVQEKLLLREINIFGENSPLVPVFTYNLKYSLGDFNHLNALTFSGMNGEKLNSTVFVYGGNKPSSHITANAATQITLNNDCSAADFNGDGLSDLIVFQYNPANVSVATGSKLYSDWFLYLNTGNGFPTWPNQTVSESPNFLPFSNFNNTLLGITPVKNGFLFADVTGDVAQELIYSKDANGTYSFIKAYKFDAVTNQMQALTLSSTYPNGFTLKTANVSNNESVCLALGDFDGNTKSELIGFWKNGTTNDYELKYLDFDNNVAIHRSTSVPVSVTDINNTNQSMSVYSNLTAYDFDGDGKSELVGYRNNSVFVVVKVTVAGTTISMQEIVTNGVTPLNHSYFGDYNGDGLPDYIKQNSTDLTVFYGTGTGFINSATIPGHGLNIYRKLIPMDINGDGKTDLVELSNNGGLDVSVCLGNKISSGFVLLGNVPNATIPQVGDDELDQFGDRDYNGIPGDIGDPYSMNPLTIPMFAVGDYNGDGFQDILLKVRTSGTTSDIRIINFNYFSDEKYITNIYDGINNDIKITYASLPKLASNVTPGYFKSVTAPTTPFVVNKTLPLTVVSKMIDNSDGVGMVNEFNYYNLLTHTKGRGVLGFDKIVKKYYNPVTLDDYRTTDEYDLNLTHFVRIPKNSKKEFISSTGNKTYYTITYNASVYSYATGANARYFSKIDGISNVNNYINSATNTTFSYDNTTGNLTSKQTDIGPGKEVTLISNSNFVNAGSWLNNSPQNQSATITRAGESSYRGIHLVTYYNISVT